uniref:Uncharacterized protein n=1 Tax=Cacopsylla melanoneura TaxID=428564 RepID=A0A8D9EE25_9HEMI
MTTDQCPISPFVHRFYSPLITYLPLFTSQHRSPFFRLLVRFRPSPVSSAGARADPRRPQLTAERDGQVRVSEVFEPVRVQAQSQAASQVRVRSRAPVQVSVLRQTVQTKGEPYVAYCAQTHVIDTSILRSNTRDKTPPYCAQIHVI